MKKITLICCAAAMLILAGCTTPPPPKPCTDNFSFSANPCGPERHF